MSLFSRITNLLGRHQPSGPSTLRNCPGGMAWVRGVPADYGAEALNGRVDESLSYLPPVPKEDDIWAPKRQVENA